MYPLYSFQSKLVEVLPYDVLKSHAGFLCMLVGIPSIKQEASSTDLSRVTPFLVLIFTEMAEGTCPMPLRRCLVAKSMSQSLSLQRVLV